MVAGGVDGQGVLALMQQRLLVQKEEVARSAPTSPSGAWPMADRVLAIRGGERPP